MKWLDLFLQRRRIAKLRSILSPQTRVLDIGCADGVLFQQLPFKPGSVGIDPDLPDRAYKPGVTFVRGRFPQDVPKTDEPFDAITMLAVLEHVPANDQAALASACYEKLAPGGKLALTVPSPAVDSILALLKKLRLIHGMSLEEHYGYDVSRTPALFESAGFKLVRHEHFQLGLNNLFVFQKPPIDLQPAGTTTPIWPRWATATIVALIAIKLFLVAVISMYAITAATYDDQLLVRLANSILSGQWLGRYDELTLAKGAIYPIFIAICRIIGVPLFLGQHLLYVAFCVTLAMAVRPFLRGWAMVTLFSIALFNPMSFGGGYLSRVIRDPVYASFTGLVIACAIGLLLRRHQSPSRLLRWSIGLGVAFSCFWLTREEGIWLAPPLAVLLGFTALSIAIRRDDRWPLRLTACALPLLIWGAALLMICTLNQKHYGVFATSELKATPFLDAYGALTRVKHETFDPRVPVPAEVRQKIYAVSPAFAELQPMLEGPQGRGWAGVAAEQVPDLHGEMGSWFLWAFRQAVAMAGHAKTGSDAMNFYRRLADEVNAACDSGKLPALPRRSTLQPPWDWRNFSPVSSRVFRGLKLVSTFNGFTTETPRSQGDESGIASFSETTGTTFSPLDPPMMRVSGWGFSPATDIDLRVMLSSGRVWPSTLTWNDSPELYAALQARGQSSPRAMHAKFTLSYPAAADAQLVVQSGSTTIVTLPLDGSPRRIDDPNLQMYVPAAVRDVDPEAFTLLRNGRLKTITFIARLYQLLTPIAAIATVIACLIQLAAFVAGRRSVWPVVTLSLILAIFARLTLLALIDVTSFPALIPIYLAPTYALLLIVCPVTLLDAARAVRDWVSRRRQPRSV